MKYSLSLESLLIVKKYSSGKAIGLTNMGLVIKLLTTVKLLLCNTVQAE